VKTLALLLLAATARAQSVAAVPFLSVGVSDEESAALASELAGAAARRSGGRATSHAAETLADDCPEDAACLRALCARLGADTVLLTVATAPASGPLVLSASRADARGRIVARVQAVVPTDARGRALAIERMAQALVPASMALLPPAPVSDPRESRPGFLAKRWPWMAAAAVALGAGIALAATFHDDGQRTETLPPQTLGTFGPGATH
jgi:hypothetical protein